MAQPTPMKATRLVLLSELRGLTVTRTSLDGADAVCLDQQLLAAAGFVEHEKVDVLVLTTGTRFACRLLASPTQGEVALTGPAAHLVREGDALSLSAFGWMKGKAAQKHVPSVVQALEGNVVSGPPLARPEKKKSKSKVA
ncbi:MAG: aspartate 1-decarboxylase [Myxococcaceae bacterium]